MAVKVFIKRRIKDGYLKEASQLVSKARYDAMGQPGYISSETLTAHLDPNIVLVISMWQSTGDWNKWNESEQRKANESEFAKIVEGATNYEMYDLGMNH